MLIPIEVCFAQNPIINSTGIWTLEKLGYTDISLSFDSNHEKNSVYYELPEGAQQGLEIWYILNLHCMVVFDELCSNGEGYINANTNGFDCAQIHFKTEKLNNELLINWSTSDLLSGVQNNSGTSKKIEINFTNYLQNNGVRSGLNKLSFTTIQYNNLKFQNVVIFSDTNIECTTESPPKLKLDIKPINQKLQVGTVFEIEYTLTNIGGKSAKEVELKTKCDDGGIECIDKIIKIPELESSSQGVLHFKVNSNGQHKILIESNTKSFINKPSITVAISVVDNIAIIPILLISLPFCFILFFVILKYLKNKKGKTLF